MLYDCIGNRKYLTREECRAFLDAACAADPHVETFCRTLVYTGARLSEVLALTPNQIDISSGSIAIRSLKKRIPGQFRAVPVPVTLLRRIDEVHDLGLFVGGQAKENGIQIWNWCRTTAWRRVKEVMKEADIVGPWGVPKGLRHAFGVIATAEASIPLPVIQKWLGHSRLETTAIYTTVMGREERLIAERLWATVGDQSVNDRVDAECF